MKVTVQLTINQAAFFVNSCFDNELRTQEKRKGQCSNRIRAVESFETQVIEQILGTKWLETYASLRRPTIRNYFIKPGDGLPTLDRPIFPYSKEYEGVIR